MRSRERRRMIHIAGIQARIRAAMACASRHSVSLWRTQACSSSVRFALSNLPVPTDSHDARPCPCPGANARHDFIRAHARPSAECQRRLSYGTGTRRLSSSNQLTTTIILETTVSSYGCTMMNALPSGITSYPGFSMLPEPHSRHAVSDRREGVIDGSSHCAPARDQGKAL